MLRKIILAIAGVVVAVGFGLTRTSIKWFNNDLTVVALAVTSGAISLAITLPQLWDEYVKRTTIDHYAYLAVDYGANAASTILMLDRDVVNVSVFRITWRWRWRWWIVPTFRRELTRARDGRSGGATVSSGIRWTIHKGAIGQAWADLCPIHFDRKESWGTSKPVRWYQWMRDTGRHNRLRMTSKEARRTWDYTYVHAYPIKDDDRRALGCVSIATKANRRNLNTDKIRRKTETVLWTMAKVATYGREPADVDSAN